MTLIGSSNNELDSPPGSGAWLHMVCVLNFALAEQQSRWWSFESEGSGRERL
jgi:hypothetical protein